MKKIVALAIVLLLSSLALSVNTRKLINFVDDQGLPRTDITSVSIRDTEDGTESTLYVDIAGEVPLENPITLTSSKSTIYTTGGTVFFCSEDYLHDLVVTFGNVTVQYFDVGGSISTCTAPDYVVSRETTYLYPTGGTSDHLRIEDALADNKNIRLMAGTYNITGDITISGYNNLTIEGVGPQTIIKNVGAGKYSCFLQAGPGHDITIRNLTVDNGNVGNPHDAFNKCIFITGNQADPALCYNILVEGVTALNAEAEALCFDYQFYTTVRNCVTVDSAWAGITLAQCKYGNIYNNKIIRSGNSPAVVGTLCAGINAQSSPYTLIHDNWVHNPWYGGVAVSTSMDTYGPSHSCSVYGNIINGHLAGAGSGNSQGAIDVGISGIDATIVPYNVDVFSNHVNQTYLSAVQYTHTAGGPYRLSCSGVATTPFVDIEIGDKIYLDGNGDTNTDGDVNDGYYYVSDVDEKTGTGDTSRDWIDLVMPHAYVLMPTNPEEGDVYSITITLNGVSSTKSYTCLAGTTRTLVINGLINAIRTSQNATSTDPWIYITTSVNYPVGDTANPTKLFLTACTNDSQYEFTASAAVTNNGGSLTPTISAARYYGLRSTLSSGLSFQHGMSSPGVMVTDGTNIKIHDNFFNGRALSAAIMMASDITAGSNVFSWANIVGSNYSYNTRSLSTAVAFRGQPTPPSVNMTTVSPTHANCYAYPNGTTFTNTGETDAMIWDVPPALVGADYIFVDLSNTAGADVQLDFAGTDTATGYDGTIDGNTDDSYGLIHIHCYINGVWTPIVAIGTWS